MMCKERNRVKSDLLTSISGIKHGFGTRAEPVAAHLTTQWSELHPSWTQVHGVAVCEVIASHQVCGNVDSFFTFAPGLPIAVVTADCVPVLLARKDGRAVAAVHAGWRGTRSRILRELWKNLENMGELPKSWVASIGPAIGPCCYEVSEDLVAGFLNEFSEYDPKIAVPEYRKLDLPGINEAELRAIGVESIEVIRSCTFCSRVGQEPLFNSYRRDGTQARQWSLVTRV